MLYQMEPRPVDFLTAAKSVLICWQVLQAVYFWALGQDNADASVADDNNNNNNNKKIEGGGGSGIATVPEMLRLTSAINNSMTSVILVHMLTLKVSTCVLSVHHVPTTVLDTGRLER